MFRSPEHSLRSLIDVSPLAIVSTTSEGQISSWNLAAEKMFGWSESEVLGKPNPLTPSEFPSSCDQDALHFFLSSTMSGCELVLQRKNGRRIEVRMWMAPMQSEQGETTGAVLIFQDLSEQNENERKLQASRSHEEALQAQLRLDEERMRLAFDAADIGLWDWNIVTGERTWSNIARRQLGVGENSSPNFDVLINALHPDDRERFKKALESAIQNGAGYAAEYRSMWPDGSVHWLSARGQVSYDSRGRPVRMTGITIDIDRHKLDESHIRLQAAALEAAANAILITDNKGTILWINRAFSELTGYSSDEVIGKNPRVLKSDEHDDRLYKDLWRTISEGNTWRGEMVNRRKDGSLYAEEMTITPVRCPTGEVCHFVAIKQDVTARKQAEQALQQAEAKYRSMFEDAIIGMFQTSPDGQVLSFNFALAQIFGFDSMAAALAEVGNIKCIYVDPTRRNEFKRLLETNGVVRDFENEVYRKDKTKIWVVVNARTIRNSDGKTLYYEGTVQDISERKLLEGQLRQAQKMEAVGRLAGGIAHDFNNALAVISGYSQVLQSNLPPDDPTHVQLEEIHKASQRAASLTRQLLAFSRKQNLQPTVLDLNSVLNETFKMLKHVVGENIDLSFTPHSAKARIKADRGQIEQILMNLVVNARDAMPKGGKLLITISNVELDQTYMHNHNFAKPGRYAMLCVSDTGIGMDKNTQAHIFEPFFTTKEPGIGTGLGLSTVYGIVKQHGGHIIAYSEPGLGTTFRVYFPEVDAAVDSIPGTKIHHVLLDGSETVLVVEDEDSLRELTCNCLQSHGYKVLYAAPGKEALESAKLYSQPIHLLLTDVVMPGISGKDLADALLRSRPEMKVLYTSGYTDDHIAHHGVLEPGVALLQKPFNLESLLMKVREVLNSRASAASA